MDGPDRNAYEPIAPRGHESAIHPAFGVFVPLRDPGSLIKTRLTPLIDLANSSEVGACPMNATERFLLRRDLLKILGKASGGIAVSRWLGPEVALAQ